MVLSFWEEEKRKDFFGFFLHFVLFTVCLMTRIQGKTELMKIWAIEHTRWISVSKPFVLIDVGLTSISDKILLHRKKFKLNCGFCLECLKAVVLPPNCVSKKLTPCSYHIMFFTRHFQHSTTLVNKETHILSIGFLQKKSEGVWQAFFCLRMFSSYSFICSEVAQWLIRITPHWSSFSCFMFVVFRIEMLRK